MEDSINELKKQINEQIKASREEAKLETERIKKYEESKQAALEAKTASNEAKIASEELIQTTKKLLDKVSELISGDSTAVIVHKIELLIQAMNTLITIIISLQKGNHINEPNKIKELEDLKEKMYQITLEAVKKNDVDIKMNSGIEIENEGEMKVEDIIGGDKKNARKRKKGKK